MVVAVVVGDFPQCRYPGAVIWLSTRDVMARASAPQCVACVRSYMQTMPTG